ncbi:MAG: hypothetical protein ACI4XJ_08765 [Eubacteriales bacterium]
MTIEECNSAAYRRFAVIHRDVIYPRIVKISRVFASDELMLRGYPKTYYTVTLMDKSGRSFTEANPAEVFLADENLRHELDTEKAAEVYET